MFSEKTKEQPLFLLRLSNLHQTLAAMFKHCKHRDKFSIHKIFSEKFLPGRAFFKIPSCFRPLIGFLPLLFLPFALPPFPLRAHTHAHACAPIRAHDARARLRSHSHARNISPNIPPLLIYPLG